MIKNHIKKILGRLRAEATTEELIKRGMKVGKNFVRQEKVVIDQSHCWLIEIGDDVKIAPRSYLLSHDGTTLQELGYCKLGIIKIGNNVFIGAGSTIMPNVIIGDNVIIGAGSLVINDIPSNSVAVGTPAKVVSSYEDYIKKNKKIMENSKLYDLSYTLGGNITEEKKQEMYNEVLKNRICFVKDDLKDRKRYIDVDKL